MNQLTTNEKMTSLEIAELTGKNHKDVMRSIRNMENSWFKIARRNFALSSYINENNRSMPMYELSKTETLYIATKFNDESRARLILRWEHLETQNQLKTIDFSNPQTVAQIAQNWANEHEKRVMAENTLKIQAPKVDYYDNVLQSQSTHTVTQVAKELGLSATALNRRLHDQRVQYKVNGTWVLYAKYQNEGLTKTKTHPVLGSNGVKRTSMTTVWTEKGRLFIHDLLKQSMSA